MTDALPLLYTDLARWFHLLTAPAEYDEEAEFYLRCLADAADGPLETLLELGSGGGNMASHYKQRVTATLTDLSPAMLRASETINPDCEHIQGDMRTLRLGRTFDAVLVHDAIVFADYVYALREDGEPLRTVHDRHVEGLFSREVWLRLLSEVGFRAMARPFEHSDVAPETAEVFVAAKPTRP